jgi:hypothetical protein
LFLPSFQATSFPSILLPPFPDSRRPSSEENLIISEKCKRDAARKEVQRWAAAHCLLLLLTWKETAMEDSAVS